MAVVTMQLSAVSKKVELAKYLMKHLAFCATRWEHPVVCQINLILHNISIQAAILEAGEPELLRD